MRGEGLEPSYLTAYAPQTYVSTISPPAQTKFFEEKFTLATKSTGAAPKTIVLEPPSLQNQTTKNQIENGIISLFAGVSTTF